MHAVYLDQDVWASICLTLLHGNLRTCIQQLRIVSMIDRTAKAAACRAILDRAEKMRSCIDRRNFASAESAFCALNGDRVPFALLARQKLQQLGAAIGYRSPRNASLHVLMRDLLLNGRVAKLTSKTWKCIKEKDSRYVAVFSDAYHLEVGNAVKLQSLCSDAGLDVCVFEWDYPRRLFEEGYFPTKEVKIAGGGYRQLYRGKLVGFYIGACKNADTSKKRKRP